MGKFLLTVISIVAIVISSKGSYGGSSEVTSYQYRCTDENKSLYFVMYEQNSQIYAGSMYIENTQIARLTLDSILSEGNLVVSVNGNAADVQIKLLQDRIIITNARVHSAEQICKCSYIKR